VVSSRDDSKVVWASSVERCTSDALADVRSSAEEDVSVSHWKGELTDPSDDEADAVDAGWPPTAPRLVRSRQTYFSQTLAPRTRTMQSEGQRVAAPANTPGPTLGSVWIKLQPAAGMSPIQ
jgi:hypothetical protein